MEGHSIHDGRRAKRPVDCGWGRSARLTFCAAALVVGASSVAGIAQTPTGVSGWSSVQFMDSAIGDPGQGKRVAEAKCAACHGIDGNSPDPQFPKLAAQNPAYLYRQLWAFKDGTRTSDVMSGIVASLSDTDMADAASFYSRQARKLDTVKDVSLAATGERVFFNGMPSCAMCHGSGGRRGMPMMGMMGRGMMGHGMMGHGMMGMMGSGMADVPSLNGQHATYILDQLNRFARGERQGTVMNRVAPTLSETNKRAVAEFLSGTP